MYNEQIEQTFSNYIKYMRFDDVEKHEFLNRFQDTINSSLLSGVLLDTPKRLMGMMLKVYFYIGKEGSDEYYDMVFSAAFNYSSN